MITIKVKNSIRCGGDYSLFISFPYDTTVIDTIRSFPTKYWNKENKEWELPVNKLGEFVEKLPRYEFDISGDCAPFEPKKVEIPTTFNFKTKPYDYQIEGFNYGMAHDKWLLADEQGLGKSKQVIDLALALREKYHFKHCLIVCGVNGLKWNWVNEVATHSNETGYILGQRTKGKKTTIPGNKTKLEDLENLDKIDNFFLITNVESLRSDDIVSKLTQYCNDGTIAFVAVDECHKCFDYDTLITTDKGNLKIGDIVTNQLNVNVMSYNETTNTFEFKPIVNWFENVVNTNLLELNIQDDNGKLHTIKCTDDHKFFTTNRGWVMAKDLTDLDDIKMFSVD